MIFPFGKYKGYDLQDIDDGYLWWVVDNCQKLNARLKHTILDELARRDEMGSRDRRRGKVPRVPVLLNIVAAGRRALSLKHHPDCGGSVAVMQEINAAADYLETHLQTLRN